MALERWELLQRQKGNATGAEIARVLRQQYGDVPLTDELPTEVQTFSEEAREKLTQEGYQIYALTGQSIRSLRESGRRFWADWHQEYPDFEAVKSRRSEVAINPDPKKFFLPESNRKTLDQQLAMVRSFSASLIKRIAGVKALIGEAPDYCELAFLHLDKTGVYLFGEEYNYDYTRTVTQVGSGVAGVGYFRRQYGLRVDYWRPDGANGRLWVVPLVVPVESR